MGVWESLFFWFFAGGAVVASVAVVALRNPLYSALALIIDFFCFAGLYALLSAHLMAILQVLVYAGAIMVLFLFIIMLLNLRDEELGRFEFRVHHLLSAGTIAGLLFFMVTAITPLMDSDSVREQRALAAASGAEALALYESSVAQDEELGEGPDAAEREARREALVRLEREARQASAVRTTTAIKGPLYADLNEAGLEAMWEERLARHERGETALNQGKWDRFDRKRLVLPPSLTAREDGIRQASFGTVEPLSLLIVNRFVIPFELTALLLLAAIVGAVIIAKRRI